MLHHGRIIFEVPMKSSGSQRIRSFANSWNSKQLWLLRSRMSLSVMESPSATITREGREARTSTPPSGNYDIE